MALGQLVDRDARGGRVADDLVVDVGDVHDPRHAVAREHAGRGGRGRRTRSSGSCRRGPARRRSDRSCTSGRGPARAARTARPPRRACCGTGGSSCAPTQDEAVGADDATGALVAGEVARRRLDGDARAGRGRGARAIARPHRVEARAAEPRPGAADREVDLRSAQSPATATRRDDLARRAIALSMPAVPGAPAGNSRPRSPRPAAPSSASQSAWRTTSPSEWPCSRGAASMSRPPSRRPSPGPNGWLSQPCPIAERAVGRRASRRASVEVRGMRDLDVGRVARHGRHRDAVARQQLGLVARRRRRRRAASSAATSSSRRAPWGVCARTSPRRSTVPATRPSSTRLSASGWRAPGSPRRAVGRLGDAPRRRAVRRSGGRRRGRGRPAPTWPRRPPRPSPGGGRHPRRPRSRGRGPRHAPASSATRSGATTMTVRATSPGSATASTACWSTVRSADEPRRACRRRPSGGCCRRPRRPRRRRVPAWRKCARWLGSSSGGVGRADAAATSPP